MANFPGSIFSPRAVADRAGVIYDALKTKVFFAKDHNDFGNEIKAIEETLGIDFDKTFRQVSKEGLVLAMNFNSESIDGSAGGEKVLDSSGHNNHGVNNGADHDPDGGFNGGGAFDFVADNDYMSLADVDFDMSLPYAISVWVKPDNLDVGKFLLGRITDSNWYIAFNDSGTIEFASGSGLSWSTNYHYDTEWHHYVFAYDGTKKYLYVDDELKGSVTQASDNGSGFLLGKYGGYEQHKWDGKIDELRIYSRLLSVDEIRNLYMARKEIHNSFVSQKDIYVDSDGKPTIQNDILGIKTAKTPATAGASGVAGDICWDADYLYICVAADTWKRVAISTW